MHQKITFPERFFNTHEQYRSLAEFLQKKGSSHPRFQGALRITDLSKHAKRLLGELFHHVENERFEFELAEEVAVTADSPRSAYRFSAIDSYLLYHLSRLVQEASRIHLAPHVFSFQKGKSDADALDHVRSYLRHQSPPFYLLRSDIKSFGDSLLRERVLSLFSGLICSDSRIMRIVQQLTRLPFQVEESRAYRFKGLPTGVGLQLTMENLYLSSLDHELARLENTCAARFGDDFIVLSVDEQRAVQAEQLITAFFRENGLLLNEEKSSRTILTTPHRFREDQAEDWITSCWIEYLGRALDAQGELTVNAEKHRTLHQILLAQIQRCEKIFRERIPRDQYFVILCQCCDQLIRGVRSRSAERIHQHLRKIGSTGALKQLDLWLAIRIAQSVHRTGFRKSAVSRTFRRKMIEAGLHSLLHYRNCNVI